MTGAHGQKLNFGLEVLGDSKVSKRRYTLQVCGYLLNLVSASENVD